MGKMVKMPCEGVGKRETVNDPIQAAPQMQQNRTNVRGNPGTSLAFLLRGSQSKLTEGHPASVAGGKWPKLTPAPALVLSDGESMMALGAHAGDHVTSELWLIPADDATAEPVLVAPRRAAHDYSMDHQGDRFVIMTNDNRQNFRLASAPEDDPTEAAWETLLQGSESLYIQHFHVTEDYVAVEEWIDGLDQGASSTRQENRRTSNFPRMPTPPTSNSPPNSTITPSVWPTRQ